MTDQEKEIFKSMLNELDEGDRKDRTCPFCKIELLLPLYMYRDFHCPYCGANIGYNEEAKMEGGRQ